MPYKTRIRITSRNAGGRDRGRGGAVVARLVPAGRGIRSGHKGRDYIFSTVSCAGMPFDLRSPHLVVTPHQSSLTRNFEAVYLLREGDSQGQVAGRRVRERCNSPVAERTGYSGKRMSFAVCVTGCSAAHTRGNADPTGYMREETEGAQINLASPAWGCLVPHPSEGGFV